MAGVCRMLAVRYPQRGLQSEYGSSNLRGQLGTNEVELTKPLDSRHCKYYNRTHGHTPSKPSSSLHLLLDHLCIVFGPRPPVRRHLPVSV